MTTSQRFVRQSSDRLLHTAPRGPNCGRPSRYDHGQRSAATVFCADGPLYLVERARASTPTLDAHISAAATLQLDWVGERPTAITATAAARLRAAPRRHLSRSRRHASTYMRGAEGGHRLPAACKSDPTSDGRQRHRCRGGRRHRRRRGGARGGGRRNSQHSYAVTDSTFCQLRDPYAARHESRNDA